MGGRDRCGSQVLMSGIGVKDQSETGCPVVESGSEIIG
jgi:hypothetical protein